MSRLASFARGCFNPLHMGLADQRDVPGALDPSAERRGHRHRSRNNRTPWLYRLADSATEGLIYAMVIFSVWAFASIPSWAVWTMNVAGYLLGVLLAIKWATRWKTGYKPARWDEGASRWPIRLLAGLTLILVAWCFVSALNARATVNVAEARFEYREHYIPWLPHSFDAPSSWFAAWQYLGLACGFWAIRDWLLGKTRRERHRSGHSDAVSDAEQDGADGPPMNRTPLPVPLPSEGRGGRSRVRGKGSYSLGSLARNGPLPLNRPGVATASSPETPAGDPAGAAQVRELESVAPRTIGRPEPSFALPVRLKRLLWVVCLNGALVAVEGILQRLSGTNELLWLLEPQRGAFNRSQFGPFDYYANAAQYLNLVWPVCLAFWWQLREARKASGRREPRAGGAPHILLVPAVLGMFSAAVFAGSRGGALVAFGLFFVAAALLLAGSQPRARHIGLAVLALLGLVSAGAAKLGGWQALNRLLAPPTSFPVGLEGGLSDFSLHCVFDCPADSVRRSWYLAYLPSVPSEPERASAFLSVSRDTLTLLIRGPSPTNQIRLVSTNFIAQFSGGRVGVTAVREGTNLTLYAEGRPLWVVTNRSRFPPLTNRISSSMLAVQRDHDAHSQAKTPTVHSVRLYAEALSPAQVFALQKLTKEEASGTTAEVKLPSPVLDITRLRLISPSSLETQLHGRTEIHKVGRRMASDFPWLGSGPGTFGPLFHLYRREARLPWTWSAHNDWLETRITFGWIGFLLASAALALVLLRSAARCGVMSSGVFNGLLWSAAAGCLVHARFDYPFQVLSVFFLFLVWTAIGSVSTWRR